jgi:prevent-host-death family protein
MALTASALRKDVYKILDQVAETGIPAEINRRGRKLRIVSVDKKSKLANAKKRLIIKGNPEELVHFDWTHPWHP